VSESLAEQPKNDLAQQLVTVELEEAGFPTTPLQSGESVSYVALYVPAKLQLWM
jgi:hypothetical protein